MALEEILTYLPILTVIGFFIAIATLFYKLGRWTEKLDNSLNNISEKLDDVSNSIDKMPSQFWSKFIDAYRMLDMVKSKGNPHRSRKDLLLEKAQKRTITYEESLELKDILEKEAKKAQAVGDLLKVFIIIGIIIFLASFFKED